MEKVLRECISVEKLSETGGIPFHLLLLADETVEAINKYLYSSDIYVAKEQLSQRLVGVFVLQSLNAHELEIKNIAVDEMYQGRGIGSYLIAHIKQLAMEQGIHILWVGTPATATRQIHFYRKNGFRKAGMRKNFFPQNYPQPIYENGILLTDMVMLQSVPDQ